MKRILALIALAVALVGIGAAASPASVSPQAKAAGSSWT